MTLGSLVVQDLTYTCRQLGDNVILNYLSSDSLSVSVSGRTINVNIVSSVTTATQIKTLLDTDLGVMYLVSIAVSGTGSNTQKTCKNALIANGVLSAVKASQIIGTLKYTAQTAGAAGNSIRVKYTAGSLLVSVATNDITVRFVNGVTTASAIKAAIAASGPANALVAVVSSGAALTVPQNIASALSFTSLVGGLDPTPGSVIVQDLTYSTDINTNVYNGKSITYTTGATAGAEVVTVVDGNTSVQIENGVSTATQIKAALDASADFNGVKSTGSIVVSNYTQLHLTKAAGTVTFGTPDNVTKSSGSVSIVDFSNLKGVSSTGSITVVDYTGLAGTTVTVAGQLLTENVEWYAVDDNDTTAGSLADAINTACDTIVVATGGYTGSVISLTAVATGTATNSLGIAKSALDSYITISGSTFTGGLNGATLTVAGHQVIESVDWTSTVNNDTTASNLSVAVNSLSEVNTTYTSGSSFLIEAAVAGAAGNTIALVSSDAVNMTISGGFLTDGKDASTITVDGNTFTKVSGAPGAGEFQVIADLTTLIDNLSSVDATDNGTVVAVVAHTAGTAGNSITMSKTGAGLTLVQLSGGINASTVTVAGHALTESTDYNATVSNDSTATSIASAVNALTEVNSTASTSTVNIVAATPGIAGNSITLATSDAVNLLKSGAVLTGGSDKYACTITGTGSNAQKTVNALQTAGAVGQGANALYHDQSTDALTSSYVYVNFHFHANNLTLINDETTGNKTISLSWDGVNVHGSLLPGQSLGWNLQTTVTGIWLKYVNAAPNYRFYVLGA